MTSGRVGSFLAVVLAIGCARAPQTLERCHASLSLRSLAERVGVPQQAEPWAWSETEESSRGLFFDAEQRVTLALDAPGDFARDLCDALRHELAERCELSGAWDSAGSCAFATSSRRAVDARGHYLQRPAQGRVTLLAAAAGPGRTELLLAATEWEN